jgi:hypothetical protein
MRGRFRACCIAAGSLVLPVALAHAATVPAPVSVNLAIPDAQPTVTVDTSVALGFDDFDSAPVIADTNGLQSYLATLNGPPAPPRAALNDLAARIAFAPGISLDVGFRGEDADLLAFDAGSDDFGALVLNDPLFAQSYAPFGDASYVGTTVKVAPNFALHVGDASSSQDRNAVNENPFASFSKPFNALVNFGTRTANTLMAGVTLNAGDWGDVDLTAAHGLDKAGLIDTGSPALTTDMVNLSARAKFDGGWVTTASYGESLTKLDIKPSALSLSSTGELHQTGYAVSVAKHGIFGDDALGLSVSRPVDPEATSDGFSSFNLSASQPVFIGTDHLLTDLKPETDIDLGYTTSFSDSFALQTNASYVMNAQGIGGTNAVQLLSRAKIKF